MRITLLYTCTVLFRIIWLGTVCVRTAVSFLPVCPSPAAFRTMGRLGSFGWFRDLLNRAVPSDHDGQAIQPNPKAKKAPSSYIIFCKEMRPQLKSTNPTASFTELGSLLGQLWTSMDDHARTPYIQQAKALKAQQTLTLVATTGETLFDYRKRALMRYEALHGHMRIPQRFVVPASEEWAEDLWGLRLGRVVDSIRNSRGHEDKKDELRVIGFMFDKQPTEVPGGHNAVGWETLRTALHTYQQLYGHVNVPQRFITPLDDPDWPEVTQGLKLGSLVTSIRHKNNYKDHSLELIDMGFVYKVTDDMKSNLYKAAWKKRRQKSDGTNNPKMES